MIRALLFLVSRLKYLTPFITRIPLLLGGIWGFVKMLSQHGAVWLLISFYPILELLIEAITGKRGPISVLVQNLLNSVLTKFLHVVFNYDLQSAINSLPIGVMNFCCYMGINANIQMLLDGYITGAIVFINLRLALIVIQIKLQLMGGTSFRR